MKASLIIQSYKDLVALELILDALRCQTYKNFKVIVAEDNNAPETRSFLERYSDLAIIHNQHPILAAPRQPRKTKRYAAPREFTDGDCIPYSTLIEGHVKLSSRKTIISGRRGYLPENRSTRLRNNLKTIISGIASVI